MHSRSSYALVLAAISSLAFSTPPLAARADAPAATTADHALLLQLAAEVAADHATIAGLRAQLAAKSQPMAPASPAASSTTYGPFTVTGKDVYLTGYNLHIQSGSGSTTGAVNGYGNLIIGYNEAPGSPNRTGSHNLILGTANNYTSYGGIVGGYYNTISAGYASILGGRRGTASGTYSTISGGYGGAASGQYAAISGGYENAASAEYSGILGGYKNSAGGEYSTISGGLNNSIGSDGLYSTISGGGSVADSGEADVEPEDGDYEDLYDQIGSVSTTVQQQGTTIKQQGTVTNLFTLASGVGANTELTLSGVNLHIVNGQGSTQTANGLGNLILGYNATQASTGQGSDDRTGSHDLILGDYNEYSSFAGIVGGSYNTISGRFSTVLDGEHNVATDYYATVTGGYENSATANYTAVLAGDSNTADQPYAAVAGGINNDADGEYASVAGGDSGLAQGQGSVVSGGYYSQVEGYDDTVSGGDNTTDNDTYGWAGGSYVTDP